MCLFQNPSVLWYKSCGQENEFDIFEFITSTGLVSNAIFIPWVHLLFYQIWAFKWEGSWNDFQIPRSCLQLVSYLVTSIMRYVVSSCWHLHVIPLVFRQDLFILKTDDEVSCVKHHDKCIWSLWFCMLIVQFFLVSSIYYMYSFYPVLHNWIGI